MNTVEIIRKKRDGGTLSRQEIDLLVKGISEGSVPDYQLSAWLMAVYFKGMTEEETTHLTDAMAHSGELLDLSAIAGIKVDKHSTGGVGDKVTLVLAPLVASTGLVVAKLSGRGLGHTGGTIDKLEAIPGFQTSLSTVQFLDQIDRVGVAVVGQTQNLAPADKSLYALRDVTATVDSIPLIVASVLSKKIAAGADVIVLDVKYGSGAFMPDYASAKELAEMLVKVGKNLKRSVSVMLSDMEQPLGKAIGHTLEVEESIETLKGQGPEDLREVVLTLGAMQLVNAERVKTLEEGKALLQHQIVSGKALVKFRELIHAQGGNANVCEDFSLMPQAQTVLPFKAEKSGYIHDVYAREIGNALKALGGGRDTKDDILDLGVGITLQKKRGDQVQAGDTLATLHINSPETETEARAALSRAYHIADEAPPAAPLIGEIIWAQ
ncbi:thymidine phosphorylase [bacterium (Candidatus Blackallbacteria) CG17_big_fil_post_rev_8_21_14_2_50_48_46]|uniref:Thymidine phosphorylase n=1 Tax=bacterium (Candidatus Blackallbacteria) CG17_big_fil_post_rev_8_21_14_2_50_48_46 TaxID=2014261 RepID=A0A2M7G9G2_9BACT|nr:MAG: thymidine phosphorylase [bacterium (Candidatus Blackallbacteria) CG18_big_fil_WC_8_21_14_2_50_49_26]PIW18681.1 MAG: thymidine phosphorylase [bacterium (Candidatus Blackallbacteria) CG17_big_fil_post_rev_8_21_14_2_50_48_46]PIW46333.1 MAG: thymidine phosphorylase [bacterium (Candidatus Blackallbacteria) CG13_big_fil_rev_8_21_14_2_50_49_14]